MLDPGRLGEEGSDDGAPLGEQGPAAEMFGVVFQGRPFDLQQLALGRFDAVQDLGLTEALCLRDHRCDAMRDGDFEIGLLAWMDADVGDFKNHGGLELRNEERMLTPAPIGLCLHP